MSHRTGKLALSVILVVIIIGAGVFFAAGKGLFSKSPLSIQNGSSVGLELVAEGFVSPVEIKPVPDGTGRMLIVDQAGVIKVLTAPGELLAEPFLDVRAKMVTLSPNGDERGLLGVAFHPLFRQNGRFYVYYSAPLRPGTPAGFNCTSTISEFMVSAADINQADMASEKIILQVDKPQPNHNAGQLEFGPDGFLYISIGDGGGANDVGLGHNPEIGNGQDTSDLLGNILRIDIDSATPYGIPPDNPFVNGGGRPEIYAFGLRNPFRFSFDSAGGHQLFVGDVGQGSFEEVDIVTLGGNYGWRIKEGRHFFDPQNPPVDLPTGPAVDAAGRPFVDPIMEYRNSQLPGGIGTAVIGGFVYHGTALPQLRGNYIFGDFAESRVTINGRLFAGIPPATPGGEWTMRELAINTSANGRLNSGLRGFGQDAGGELYVLVAGPPRGPVGTTGRVFKIVP